MPIARSARPTSARRPLSVPSRPTWLACCVLSLFAPVALADEPVFELGTVAVSGSKQQGQEETVLSTQDLLDHDLDTVSEAMRLIPGVSITRNSRNESMIYVRGFDPRRVPVFQDGIPLYVPYDGYVDFDRFTTFDLSQIRVAKGAASLLYGPNTLGGAINLVSRKPTRELEGDVRLGYASGNERKAAFNLGTNQGLWYMQLSASTLRADDYPLGRGFRDYKATPSDTGGSRANADRADTRYSVKFGLTPNATDEYAIAYVRQDGKKGNPAYTGDLASGGKVNRYWRWPYWDKESLYFVSSTALGQDHTLKTRVYYDKYKNGLDMYTDRTYTTLDGPRSVYNDRSYGASVELISRALHDHQLHFALHHKNDEHDDTGKQFNDVTQSAAFEDLIALAPQWSLRLGASYEYRKSKKADIFPIGSTSGTNGLAELMFDLSAEHQVFGSLSYRTRFPTIKDRYSGRMGRFMANPALKREASTNIEIGYRGQPWRGALMETALFHSNLSNEIQEAILPDPGGVCPGNNNSTCNQMQNIGKTRHSGIELQLEQSFNRQWRAGLAYTYLNRSSRSDPGIQLIDTPRHRLFAHLGWKPHAQWDVLATVEAEQGRHDSYSAAKPYIRLPGYAVAGLSATWLPRKDISLQFGVNNLTDKNYFLADGYPMPGRVLYANARYQF